ncbi:MAG: sulfotransferase, partial [Parasphingopyxis sp.]|uniref:sulfotransferase n=1 Tax=Parasphingopyxis sp. TaxID=1920299 RepID=UPI0032EEC515
MSQSKDPSTDAISAARQQLVAGRPDATIALLEPALESDPDSIEALYMRAVCERYARRIDDARRTLAAIKALSPEFGRVHQEEGHLLCSVGEDNAALSAFQRATRFNPALEASWRAQGDLLSAMGRPGEAAEAVAQAERLKSLPKDVVAVAHLLHEGKLLKAENLCRAHLKQHPRDVEAMRLLAEIGSRFGVLEDAEFLIESAVAFEPDNIQLRLDYIQVLRKRQKFGEALDQAKALYDRDPDNPIFQSHLAIESMQVGDYDRAFELFDAILKQLPGDPAAKPDQGDAWYALANLKTYRFEEAEIDRMREQEARGDLAHMDRVHICFALGKALEDRKHYQASFGYYERGNDLKRLQSRYDADQMSGEFAAQREICTAELFDKQAGNGCPAPDPIFIVGLPRAGSTLLEQILASHSLIDGTLELPNILSLSQRLRGRQRASGELPYPQNLHNLDEDQLRTFGEEYIEDTRIHRQRAPLFIDKMPNNFRHIGLIHLILPNAKIIDARRDPMDCCFSCFKQLFAEGQEFTYGLEQVGQYYADYVALMEHWDEVLPGRILRVQHENVLDDLEGQVRRMLDYLELPFEQACIDFHRTERAIRTASSEQVRRPINRS